ncbi:Lipase 3 [Orchesella cincta]|uniref:Lipase 3 n=1 Tax=Orchesella cincta TaxID=48709 RepID=A0A1D2MA99_ORCCI|nr:Lipase 3 [Orchesella cincta]
MASKIPKSEVSKRWVKVPISEHEQPSLASVLMGASVVQDTWTEEITLRDFYYQVFAPDYKIEYPFKTWAECRRGLESGEISSRREPNVPMSMMEEIGLRGYNVSLHTIQSDDGYISSIYRISGCLKSPPRFGKQSVLLFHGGFGGSASWIIQPGSRNLAFTLVEAGYEVWLANLRGTTPSQNHTKLNSQTDLIYGNLHSKILAGFYLAPGTFLGSSHNPLLKLWATIVGSPMEQIMFNIMKGKADGEPGSVAKALGLTPQNLCSWKYLRCGVCDSIFFALYGNDAMQLNYEDFPNAIAKLQDTFGLRLLIHGMQNYKNCSFRKYDYGSERNLLKYGSTQPPHYNMEKVAAPTYLFYGENDNMVTSADVARLRDSLPPKFMRGYHGVEWTAFNHVDFLIAKDADVLLYNKILQTMKELDSRS